MAKFNGKIYCLMKRFRSSTVLFSNQDKTPTTFLQKHTSVSSSFYSIFTYIPILLLIFASFHYSNSQTTDSVVILENYKMPEYKKDTGKLQFILYGKKAETQGQGVIIKLTDVLVDIVKDDVDDVKKVKNLQSLNKMYEINSSRQQIIDFWKDKQHSKALVLTPSATYDRVTKTVRGNDKVFLRTPELDINGVGFDADYEHHKIHVRSKVKVVIHTHIESLMKKRKYKVNKTEGNAK